VAQISKGSGQRPVRAGGFGLKQGKVDIQRSAAEKKKGKGGASGHHRKDDLGKGKAAFVRKKKTTEV